MSTARARLAGALLGTGALLVVAFLLGASVGAGKASLGALFDPQDEIARTILLDVRLPRVLSPRCSAEP